jgi:hypothetical protein
MKGVPLFPIGRKEYNWPERQREKKKEIPLPPYAGRRGERTQAVRSWGK